MSGGSRVIMFVKLHAYRKAAYTFEPTVQRPSYRLFIKNPEWLFPDILRMRRVCKIKNASVY